MSDAMATSYSSSNKQYLWIVRYGLTEFPLVEHKGPYDSPLDPHDGVEHAKAIAGRIHRDIAAPAVSKPVHVYSSPFIRTTHTAQLIAIDLARGSKVRIEGGLTEWQQPSLLVDLNDIRTFPKSKRELAGIYGTIDLGYESLNPSVADDCDPVPEGAPQFEESEEALLKRCSTTLERILAQAGNDSFVIVSHAPCDQALAIHLEGKGLSDSSLGPWPLGGITRFSRSVDKSSGSLAQWKMEYYGETKHMPGKYKPGIKEWSLPSLCN